MFCTLSLRSVYCNTCNLSRAGRVVKSRKIKFIGGVRRPGLGGHVTTGKKPGSPIVRRCNESPAKYDFCSADCAQRAAEQCGSTDPWTHGSTTAPGVLRLVRGQSRLSINAARIVVRPGLTTQLVVTGSNLCQGSRDAAGEIFNDTVALPFRENSARDSFSGG